MSIMILGAKGIWRVWFAGSWSGPMSKREALSHAAYILLTNGKKEVRCGK